MDIHGPGWNLAPLLKKNSIRSRPRQRIPARGGHPSPLAWRIRRASSACQGRLAAVLAHGETVHPYRYRWWGQLMMIIRTADRPCVKEYVNYFSRAPALLSVRVLQHKQRRIRGPKCRHRDAEIQRRREVKLLLAFFSASLFLCGGSSAVWLRPTAARSLKTARFK